MAPAWEREGQKKFLKMNVHRLGFCVMLFIGNIYGLKNPKAHMRVSTHHGGAKMVRYRLFLASKDEKALVYDTEYFGDAVRAMHQLPLKEGASLELYLQVNENADLVLCDRRDS